MKERFRGPLLVDAILRQGLVTCDPAAAKRIAKLCKIIEVDAGNQFITEGDETSDVFFILQGTVDIFIKGSLVATRTSGQHVGEMAPLLNSRRTASAVARENTVAAKITGTAFLKLGNEFPGIFREVARVLAIRLDQRRNLIREPNIRPRIFIASSTEAKPVAYLLKSGLTDTRWDVEVWDEAQVFAPSTTFIQTLTGVAQRSDFGVAVFGRDDKTTSRKQRTDSPRDNTVFEGGMFIGAIGLERTYFLTPNSNNFKKLTDLEGVVVLPYKRTKRTIDVHAVINKIRERIEKLGVR